MCFWLSKKVQKLWEKILKYPARPNVWGSKWRPNLDLQGHTSLEVRHAKTFKCLFLWECQFYLLIWGIYTETPTVTKHNNNTLMREKGWYLMTLLAQCCFTPLCCCMCVVLKENVNIKRPAHGHKSASTLCRSSFHPLEGREDTTNSLSKDCCSKKKEQRGTKS